MAGMADSTAHQIIAVALRTHLTHPDASVLDVLDLAMQGREGTDLCFEAEPGQPFENWLDPPSPFADLLRQAIAPELTAQQVRLWLSKNEFLSTCFREMWQDDVVQAFADRYRLWGDSQCR